MMERTPSVFYHNFNVFVSADLSAENNVKY